MSIKLRKYTSETVLREAEMYLEGYSITQIAKQLKMPNQTVSWHLIYPLKEIDYTSWIEIRDRLLKRAKNPKRHDYEKRCINFHTKWINNPYLD